ncbi:MAG: response regulator transcription factor [Dehalococcoides mccartyi]|uniref:response regulator transcription factor n=1 Tax=Dehalococcoides mccartyi TaxID=61435 RepID=UPI0030F649A4
MKTALIVEDDVFVQRFVETTLHNTGWRVEVTRDGIEGIQKAELRHPQLVVLDLLMPRLDGIGFLTRFREWSNAPVIIVSALTDVRDRITLLKLGADHYLTKPFTAAELLAHIDATIRRFDAGANKPIDQFECGPLVICSKARQVTLAGTEVKLTRHEFDLLKMLIDQVGQVVESGRLIKNVWNNGEAGHHDLQVAVSSLRQKLGDHRDLIINIHGIGYKFSGTT